MTTSRTPCISPFFLALFGVAAGAVACTPTDVAPRLATRIAPAPLHVSSAVSLAADSCPKAAGKKVAAEWRSCEPDKHGVVHRCAKYDPPLSDRCAAESGRSRGVEVDYRYFGHTDCNSSERTDDVTRIVIHNGGKAKAHVATWQCRKSGTHYTIERDGRIFQHVGEERWTPHASANKMNRKSIGIELETRLAYGGSCNEVKTHATIAKKRGIADEDLIAELCGPTPAQYESLRALIADIETRHPIRDDGVSGHCEVQVPAKLAHGDPRALDWRELDMAMRPKVAWCHAYGFAAVKAHRLTASPHKGGTSLLIPRGRNHGIEVGDHAYLSDDRDKHVVWFEIDKVDDDSSYGWVALTPAEIDSRKLVTVVSWPGKKPTRSLSKHARGLTNTDTEAGKPALGSCATDYGYHKAGTIASWTTRTDGTIDTVSITKAGWDHRICDDSTGLVYVDAVDGDYLTDASGKKMKLAVTSVEATTVTARVTEGAIDPTRLGKSRRVVLRAKKQ